ncbi:MAG: hypothetical protein AAGJ35_04630 [Myxococcota bacterium]
MQQNQYWWLCLVGLGFLGCKKPLPKLKATAQSNALVAPALPKNDQGGFFSGKTRRAFYPGAEVTQNAASLWVSSAMSAATINRILGGFVYKAVATYKGKRRGRRVLLKETSSLSQTLKGPFRYHTRNQRQKEVEVRWVNNALYWKGKGRPFRIVAHDPDDALRWQQRAYGHWRSLVVIFGEAIRFRTQGQKQIAGRPCLAYNITLRKTTDPSLGKVPEGTAWAGKLPEHTRGNAAKKDRLPNAAKGNVCFDKTYGFPLEVDFHGSYRIARSKAEINLTLRTEFLRAGAPSVSVPPKSVVLKRAPEPMDAFAQKPSFLQPPPKRR